MLIFIAAIRDVRRGALSAIGVGGEWWIIWTSLLTY